MALFRDSAFSPSANLHPDRSALVCTPVTLALRQLNSNPRLWLAWSTARQSCSATKDAPAPAGPCAPARSAPTVRKRETLGIKTATTNNDLFIVPPQWKISGQG